MPSGRGLNEPAPTKLRTLYAAIRSVATASAWAANAPTGTTTGGVSRQRNVAHVPQNSPRPVDHASAGHGRGWDRARGRKYQPTQTESSACQETPVTRRL